MTEASPVCSLRRLHGSDTDGSLLSDRDLALMLYELLDTESLLTPERCAEHSREVFDATLQTARQLAEK